MARNPKPARTPLEDRPRPVGEALPYILGNPIRNEALSILAEGSRSTSELAKIMGIDLKVLGNHIRELYENGCIEIASVVPRRNVNETFYRAVVLPHVTDEAYQAMSMEQRRDVNGVTLQSILSETLTAHQAGTMERSKHLWLVWDAANLDEQGEADLAALMAATYEKANGIKTEAAGRLGETGETGRTSIFTLTAFPRGRENRPERGYTPSSDS